VGLHRNYKLLYPRGYISATGGQHEFADLKFEERVGRWNGVEEWGDMKYIILTGWYPN